MIDFQYRTDKMELWGLPKMVSKWSIVHLTPIDRLFPMSPSDVSK